MFHYTCFQEDVNREMIIVTISDLYNGGVGLPLWVVDKLERENYGKIKKRGIESGWGIVYSGGDGYFFNRMYE